MAPSDRFTARTPNRLLEVRHSEMPTMPYLRPGADMPKTSIAVLSLALVLLGGCADASDPDASAPSQASATAAHSSGASAPASVPVTATVAATPAPVVITVADGDGNDTRSATPTVGQLVLVDLETCGGCGYSWTVDTAPSPATATQETVSQPPSPSAAPTNGPPLVGRPTTTRLAFQARAAGETSVSIGYHGPGGGPAERTVVMTLTVTGP
jgi:hypothetical protein